MRVAADAAVPEPERLSLAALLPELRPHTELDLKTLAYHAQQSDATAADGYHHASVNEARSFLEALVVGIVQVVEYQARGRKARVRLQSSTPTVVTFSTHRRYLLENGFTDEDENNVLANAYSVASAKGSHHGITDATWTYLARRIVFAASQYTLQRYAARKRRNSKRRAKSPIDEPVAVRGGFWRRLRVWRSLVASSE